MQVVWHGKQKALPRMLHATCAIRQVTWRTVERLTLWFSHTVSTGQGCRVALYGCGAKVLLQIDRAMSKEHEFTENFSVRRGQIPDLPNGQKAEDVQLQLLTPAAMPLNLPNTP